MSVNAFQRNEPLVSVGRAGETITFFPTYGCRNPEGGGWKVTVHGWVYRPKESSLRRAAVLSLLRRAARLDRDTIASVTLKGRLRPFLFDNKPGRRFSIELGQVIHDLPASNPHGHFQVTLDIADDSLPPQPAASPEKSLPFFVSGQGEGESSPAAEIRLIGEEGVSIISDIDDTIKISEVTNRGELFANTFIRDFRAAPKMADAYRHWANAGASFHYVSASPWQLFDPLSELLADQRFPAGSVHLRNFRFKDRSLIEFLTDTDVAKRKVAEKLLHDFPRRQFVLVGDSGERDPEMYAGLARDFSAQVRHIYIRNVTGEQRDCDRFKQAFHAVSDEKWTLFAAEAGLDAEATGL
ncbi:MAG: DUF2183 domain-containing protein [Planctomycetaceae bacterium]|nr:DUF2183 domain-containing protein [Planctomycetaceae bacterium]MBT6156885.1 DUF2183 domain-containing protein [Planctomycetaceae bacterium]MBT6484197.1 DUF2183 domain-containing protein [Planctomycetaceae bacterium]MBT6496542.1 DUF2183 domain-containing protein [Planctomycetaceae bacterium]